MIETFTKFIKIFLLKQNIVLTRSMLYMHRNMTTYLSGEVGDYVRISSLELAAYEINSKKIIGNVAELGVYKGDFAKLINKSFPNRKLYLFDTFEGFKEKDVEVEKEKGYSTGMQDFSDTNIDIVLKKMTYPQNIIVKQGYFPETAVGLKDNFVFVSIDVDLYKPTYDGLNYFYRLLNKGGYIFVHDYNNHQYKGVKKAIQKYCSENEVRYFPLCDTCGTAVISK